MNVTDALRKWLTDERDLQADADDKTIREAAGAALADGSLTTEKFLDLTKTEEQQTAGALLKTLDSIAERLEKLETKEAEPKLKEDAPLAEKARREPSDYEKLLAQAAEFDSTPEGVDTVPAHKQYGTTKGAMMFPQLTPKGQSHPYAGQPVFEGGRGASGQRIIESRSQLEKAVCGVYWKWSIESCQRGGPIPQGLRMTDHDRDLLAYALREMEWGGVINGQGDEDPGAIGIQCRKLTPREQKAIIDDSTSGGTEAAPVVFDDAVILPAILQGDLFPYVNTVNLTRGRRVEGVSFGTVTVAWGGGDGTAITLFNTASFISAFDTTVHTCDGSIEIGLDFLADSPVAVDQILTAQYGQVMAKELDDVIAVGNGTTQPDGIVNSTGITVVNTTGGAGGPPTVGDYEALMFGVNKEYQAGFPTASTVFCGTLTSYRRARGIAVNTTSDARRVFGMDHRNYMLLDAPYKINSDLTNRQTFYGVLPRYRMYRRLGQTIRSTTEGRTLVRANEMLLVARMRYGGQTESGSAFSNAVDGQS